MWFWNRREIYFGYSLKDFSEMKEKLAAKNIPYDYKVVDLNTSRGRFGSVSLNKDFNTQYYLYVHKKNLEEVLFLLRN
jgi:hypothetical protein